MNKTEMWHVRPDYVQGNVYRIWDGNDNYHDDTSPDAMDKRAALIEAAPDLLDALEGLVNGLADEELTAINAGYARAAISKARNNQR